MIYKIKELKRKVSYFLRPRQKWLTKTIPRHWCDKPELIRDVLFTILVNFVEEERGIEMMEYQYRDDKEMEAVYLPAVRDLTEAYRYIKTGRAELEKEEDAAHPKPLVKEIFEEPKTCSTWGKTYAMKSCEELYGGPFNEVYGEALRLQALIEEKDNWCLNKILEYRKMLWT